MKIEDFIKNNQLNGAVLEHLLQNFSAKTEISWGENGYYQKNFTFENGVKLGVDSQNNCFIQANDGRSARFRADKSLETLIEKDGSGTCYFQNGKVESILFANGSGLCFEEETGNVFGYRKPGGKEWNTIYGYVEKFFHDTTADEAEALFEVISTLEKSEVQAMTVHVHKGEFVNELNDFDETTLPIAPDGFVAVYDPLIVKDEDIPKDMQNIGIQIKRDFEQAFVSWDEKSGEKVYRNEKGEIFKPKAKDSCAHVGGTNIIVHTCQFIYSKEDYRRMQEIEKEINEATAEFNNAADKHNLKWKVLCALSDKDFGLYMDYAKDHDIKNTLYHEMKHIKNRLLCEHRAFASDYLKPKMEREYDLEAHNERTATLEPLAAAIKKYLKKGDYKDLSPFYPDFDDVAGMLRYKSEDEIKKMCYPPQALMNEALHHWNKNFLGEYFEQIQRKCEGTAKAMLLAKDDVNDKEYKKQCRLMYTFECFNPYTGKEEMIDMSHLLDMKISHSDEAKKDILEPCKKMRREEKKKIAEMYQDNEGKILLSNMAEIMRREYMLIYKRNIKGSGADNIMEDAKKAVPVYRGVCNRFVGKAVQLKKHILHKFAHVKERFIPEAEITFDAKMRTEMVQKFIKHTER